MKFTDFVRKIDEAKEDLVINAIKKAKSLKELKKIRDVLFNMDISNKIMMKIRKELDTAMKVFTLREERLHSKDKRAIMGYMKSPKAVQYKMSDGETITVKPIKDGAVLTFNKDNFELAMTITDLADALGLSISKSSPGSITINEV